MYTNPNRQLRPLLRFVRPALLLVLCAAFAAASNAQNASPKDKPVQANTEQAKKIDDEIAPYVRKARETLPNAKAKYLAGLPKDETLFVSIKLYDPDKKFEFVFVRVTSWKGDAIEGIEASNLDMLKHHEKGETVKCKESDVLDWTISKPDGTEEGNFVGKFLDTYKP